jgi:hypothetical protein
MINEIVNYYNRTYNDVSQLYKQLLNITAMYTLASKLAGDKI